MSLTSVVRSLTGQLREQPETPHAGIDTEGLLGLIFAHAQDLRAWRHPLGFLHVELTDIAGLDTGERLRLHLWTDFNGATDAAGSLHEHTWSLTSLVVHGSLRDRNFQATQASDGEYGGARVVYGEKNHFVDAGRFNLTPTADRHVFAGGVYRIPSRVIHETQVQTLPTLTLAMTREEHGDSPGPLLISAEGLAAKGTESRHAMDGASIQRELRATGLL